MLLENEPAKLVGDREIVAVRVFDAPRELVFKVWTDPKHIGNWWGPKGFVTTTFSMDVRPGGVWRFVMHGPDGANYPNHNVFKVVDAPNRVSLDHISGDHHFALDITLTRKGNQTRVDWLQTFDSVEHKQHIAQWVEPANEQNLDRLQREVARGIP